MAFVVSRLFALTGLLLFTGPRACSIVAVGREASASGHPMVSHTEDMGPAPHDIRLIRVPHKTWATGSKRPLYRWQENYPRVRSSILSPEYAPVGDQQESEPFAQIPQVSETYAYWDTDYGVQNEMGVSIGESTCDARTVGFPIGQPGGFNRIGIEDLSKLALERCATARCAVEVMGKVAVEEGFYSADSGTIDAPAFADSAEALVVGDATPGDLWIFNVMTGANNASAIWAAQRVPPDHVAVVANSFTISKMNLSDSENFLYSPGVSDLAFEKGWWSPEQESSPDIFDFYGSYGNFPPLEKDRMIPAYYSGRRMWRVYSLLSPSEGAKLDPNTPHLPGTPGLFPNSVPAPKGSVTLNKVFDVLRDHYEGTPYDLTQGMAAGPFGNPNRGVARGVPGQWERAISMYRTAWSFVLEAKPNGRAITWFGWDAPHGTAYLPFFAASPHGAPASYTSHDAHMSKFSFDGAWWAFSLVNQYQDLNFRAINVEVRAKSSKIEAEALKMVAKWEAEADKMGKDDSLKHLSMASNAFAEEKVKEWWDLAWFLIGKYRGYVVTYNESHCEPGDYVYPEWWLRSPEVGFSSWKPSGPWHGVFLDYSSTLSAAHEFVRSFRETAGSSVVTAAVAGIVGVLSYRAGLQKGRTSFDVENCYIAHS